MSTETVRPRYRTRAETSQFTFSARPFFDPLRGGPELGNSEDPGDVETGSVRTGVSPERLRTQISGERAPLPIWVL